MQAKQYQNMGASRGSLSSQEQVEAAIRDLVRQQDKKAGCCRGEPITNAGKRRQLAKMLFLTLVPILILMGLSVYFMSESVRSRLESAKLRTKIAFSIEVGRFIYSFQRERDMSVLFLSDLGPGTKTFLLGRYPDTDEALEALSEWPADVDRLKRDEFASKQAFLRYLNKHRNQLDLVNFTIYDEINFYSAATHVFVRWLYDSIKESKYGTIWKTLVAYQKVIAALEDVGVERALGAAYFALGKFDSDTHYQLYNEKVHLFKANIRAAKSFSPLVAPIADYRVQTTAKNISANIFYFRDEIRKNYFYKRTLLSSAKKGTWWYDNMTLYIDILLDVQQDLAREIDLLLNDKATSETTTVAISAIIIIIVFSMCPIIIRTVHQLTNDIQSYALTLADKTKELNQEKRKTDTLLYQMLPKPVADQLKNRREVNAEYYREVTIFFSDIVDFTRISSECTPMEIVAMLNYLYTLFDERIELYDVYKVETIGDSYMVASGLPTRNGNRHASEIANMSLDLMKTVTGVQLPELSDEPDCKIRLRIGIHTGPCVAGVVGHKLPRYCLFGDTVNTASRMETHGMSDSIHISSSVHRLLQKRGGYLMKQRGEINIKGKGKMVTYWLQGKDKNVSVSTESLSEAHGPSRHTKKPSLSQGQNPSSKSNVKFKDRRGDGSAYD